MGMFTRKWFQLWRNICWTIGFIPDKQNIENLTFSTLPSSQPLQPDSIPTAPDIKSKESFQSWLVVHAIITSRGKINRFLKPLAMGSPPGCHPRKPQNFNGNGLVTGNDALFKAAPAHLLTSLKGNKSVQLERTKGRSKILRLRWIISVTVCMLFCYACMCYN